MAFQIVDYLKGENGRIVFWVPSKLWIGPNFSNGQKDPLVKSSSNSNESWYVNRGLPWNDAGSELTYANEGICQGNVQMNYERLSLVINVGGEGIVSREIKLKNGVKILIDSTNNQNLRVYDSEGNLRVTYPSIVYNTRYSHGLYCCIDEVAQEATFVAWYWNPTYQHGGSNQYAGYYASGATFSQTTRRDLYQLLVGNIPIPDPYDGHNNNYSNPIGGQTGTWDETSDTITEPAIPTLSGVTSGFVTAYVPTLSQINDLADKMVDPNIIQILGNTLLSLSDIVISLSLFPFQVPKVAADKQVQINVLGMHWGTGVYVDKATAHYVDINCGSLEVKEYWANCMDYNPYTKISIYLPFCGFYELDTDDVMGKTLQVKYRVDIMSGSCLATILVNSSVMYQYAGQCSSQIPISSVSYDSFMQSMINVGVATATGGAGLAAAGASAAVGHARADSNENKDMAQLQHNQVQASYTKTVLDSGISAQAALANVVMSSKGQYKHAGAMQGIAGFMGVKKPYLIIKRPNQQIPADYGRYHGYPAVTRAKLGNLEGYTVVDDIRLNIPEATVEEIIECEKLLKGGIII